ncbi:hypothetical protein IWZ00DRAFT_542321 [Phyllosticta capitalensis]
MRFSTVCMAVFLMAVSFMGAALAAPLHPTPTVAPAEPFDEGAVYSAVSALGDAFGGTRTPESGVRWKYHGFSEHIHWNLPTERFPSLLQTYTHTVVNHMTKTKDKKVGVTHKTETHKHKYVCTADVSSWDRADHHTHHHSPHFSEEASPWETTRCFYTRTSSTKDSHPSMHDVTPRVIAVTSDSAPMVTPFPSAATATPISGYRSEPSKKLEIRDVKETSAVSSWPTYERFPDIPTRTVAAWNLNVLLDASPKQSEALLAPEAPRYVPDPLPSGCFAVPFNHGRGPLSVIICSKDDEKRLKDFVHFERKMDSDIFWFQHDFDDEMRRERLFEVIDKSGSNCVNVVWDHNSRPLVKAQRTPVTRRRLCTKKDKKKFKKWAMRTMYKDDLDADYAHLREDKQMLKKLKNDIKQQKKEMARLQQRDVSASSGALEADPSDPQCMFVTYKHGGAETIEKRLCGKEMKEQFEQWAGHRKWDDHEMFQKEHAYSDKEMKKDLWKLMDDKKTASDCIHFSFAHDLGAWLGKDQNMSPRVDRELCGKKEKKEFKDWVDRMMDHDHFNMNLEHNRIDKANAKEFADAI